MLRVCTALLLSVLFFASGCGSLTFAAVSTPPPAPRAPSAPIAPPAPEPPSDQSGDYAIKEVKGLRVRVFAHPPKENNAKSKPVSSSNSALVCNLSDPDSATVTDPTGWHIQPGNVVYRLNLSSVPSTVGKSNLNNIVLNGFSQYSQATGGKVTFSRGADTSVSRSRYDGQNVVTWGRLSNGTLGVTYTWYYPSTGVVAETDTVMNSNYKWSYSNSYVCANTNTYDAQDILTHEEGHWMGLTDEYDSSLFGDNTMFGYGSTGEVKKSTLTTGDKTGIFNIYSGL